MKTNNHNWMYKDVQSEIIMFLEPKINNWRAEGRPKAITYFTDGLLRWICMQEELILSKQEQEFMKKIEALRKDECTCEDDGLDDTIDEVCHFCFIIDKHFPEVQK